ncbi:MAG: ATP-binding cassette domain-containing protein [Actinotalea sp.]|nr:ATP-binding cassette domain-containing protein [Actinotalea sp.]
MHELRLSGVTRTFGDRRALEDVTFTVRPGRVTGFIGANGAGKTTAMRIVVGVLAPDAGTVTWGDRPVTRADRRRFGYMPEERGLYPKMPVLEQLVYLGRVHGLRTGLARERAEALLERLALAERAGDLLQSLSLGNQQRVQVAAALVHDPTALVLDEPFSGLDPLAVDAMAELLQEHAAGGVPVLFSSHQLELVERICDDVVIIDHGRVVAAGSAQEVRAAHTGRRLRLRVEVPGGSGTPVAMGPEPLTGVPGVVGVRADGERLLVDLTDDADDQAVLTAAQRAGTVREFAPVVPTLAQIFREVVR